MYNINRPIDAKRDEYRKYLERTGVLQAISRSLSKLYDETEKPNDAIGYVYNSIGESCANQEAQKDLEAELAEERNKTKKLTAELEDIKAKFAAFKKAEIDAATDEDAMLDDIADTETISGTVSAASERVITAATPESANDSTPSAGIVTPDSAAAPTVAPTPASEVAATPSDTPRESADVSMSSESVSTTTNAV